MVSSFAVFGNAQVEMPVPARDYMVVRFGLAIVQYPDMHKHDGDKLLLALLCLLVRHDGEDSMPYVGIPGPHGEGSHHPLGSKVFLEPET